MNLNFKFQISNFQKITFILLLIVLPSQLGIHFWPDWALINGVRIDYFSPTLYFTDVLILILVMLNLFQHLNSRIRERSRNKFGMTRTRLLPYCVTGLLVLLNVYFSYSPAVTIYKWLKVAEMGFLFFWITKNKTTLLTYYPSILIIPIVYSCVLAIWQYLVGGSVGGLWYLLGERTFTFDTPGIAPWRPYATFPHPNVLMGFLIVMGGLILARLTHISRKLTVLLLALILLVLCLLPSRGNLLGGWSLRQQLNHIAIEQWIKSPIIGTGLGTSPLYPRNITNFALLHQPIHNIFLLILSETGLIGLSLFLWVLKKRFSWILVVILFLGFFDHYWLTLQQGQLLLTSVLGIML